MFKNINKLLKELTKQGDKEFPQYLEIEKRWKKKISKKIKKNAKIVDFTNNTLTIKAKNGAWKNDLLFIQEDIKKNFQTKQ